MERPEKIEQIKRYIERTRIPEDLTLRFQLTAGELGALGELTRFDMICLAFDFGKAKGYRMRKQEARK